MRSLLIPLLLGVSVGAASAEDSYYAGFQFGISKSLDETIEATSSGLSLEDQKNLGHMGGLYVGQIVGRWRFEGEYTVRQHHYRKVDILNNGGLDLGTGSVRAGGKQASSAIMGNAWYEFASSEDWKFFAGLGFGLADLEVERERSAGTVIMDDSKTSLAGQAMLQMVRQFDNGLEAGLGVRHFRVFTRNFESQAGVTDYRQHTNELFARLSWRFGSEFARRSSSPARPAPAPVAAPAPEPAPAPQPAPTVTQQVVEEPAPEPTPVPLPGPFIVFFDFDKSDITPEAARIIREAAKAYKEDRTVRIMATGHTDSAGASAYNQRLSERRAEAVRAALVAEGVNARHIRTAAEGEGNQLVSTGDGVREPQNRRTEIVLSRR